MAVRPGSIWATLGIGATRDADEIRRAYSSRLKQTNPEDDPEGFQALRRAYEQAMRLATQPGRSARARSAPEAGDEPAGAPSGSAIIRPVQGGQDAGNEEDRAGTLDLADETAHAALCNRLGQAMADPEVSQADLIEALNRVLTSPALESMAIHQRTETWLASLIANNAPGSDPLLDAAIDHFRWDVSRDVRSRVGAAAVARREDLRFLAALRRPGHPMHAAYITLSRPKAFWRRRLDRLTPGLRSQVATLLGELQGTHPSLIGSLDPASLARWRLRLALPDYGAVSFWSALCLPPALALIIVNANAFDAPFPVAFGIAWAAALAAVVAGQLAWLYGLVQPRERWRQRRAHSASAWTRLGWAPTAILILAAAAAAPPTLAGGALLAVASLAVAAWAFITGAPDTRPGVWFGVPLPWQLRALFGPVYVCVFWVFAARNGADLDAWAQMSPPLIGLMFVWAVGANSLAGQWLRVSVTTRRIALIGMGAAAALSPLLLWWGARGSVEVSGGAATVAALALAHRTPAIQLGPAFARARELSLRFGLFVWSVVAAAAAPNEADALLLMAALWLLTAVALAVLGALRAEGPLFGRLKTHPA